MLTHTRDGWLLKWFFSGDLEIAVKRERVRKEI